MKFKVGDKVYTAKHDRTGVIISTDDVGRYYRFDGEAPTAWHHEDDLVLAGDVHTEPEPKAEGDHGA